MKRRTVHARNRAAAADYLAAALLIEQGHQYACCYALSAAAPTRGTHLAHAMVDVFEDSSPDRRLGYWMAEWTERVGGGDPDVQNRRVLALCFMATLAEAGDL